MDLTLIKKEILSPSVRAYYFTPEKPLDFKPGQFVMLKQKGAEQRYARAFSIASAPNDETLCFIMKHTTDGHVSGFLHHAEIGAQIETGPALGRFTLEPNDTDRVFVATGTGLAPILSFITSHQSIPSVTVFGVRNEEDIFGTEHFSNSSIITLSQPSPSWTGAHGRVTAHIQTLVTHHPDATFYLCGNPEMVKEVRSMLLAANIEQKNIKFEVY